MRPVIAIVIALGAMGCRQILGLESGTVGKDASIEIDAPEDADVEPDMMVDAFTGWRDIAIVQGLAVGDQDPTLTGDMLELYFTRGTDVYFTTRASVTSAWATPQMAMFAQMMVDQNPELTVEGLFMLIASDRGAGSKLDIYYLSRQSRTTNNWSMPIAITDLNDTNFDDRPGSATTSGANLVLSSDRNGNNTGVDLYESVRPGAVGTAYNTPVRMPVSTTSDDSSPFLTNDGLTLYFASGQNVQRDLYVSTRASLDDPFTTSSPITELNTTANDSDPWVSPDGKEIYFSSNRDGQIRIYHASRP